MFRFHGRSVVFRPQSCCCTPFHKLLALDNEGQCRWRASNRSPACFKIGISTVLQMHNVALNGDKRTEIFTLRLWAVCRYLHNDRFMLVAKHYLLLSNVFSKMKTVKFELFVFGKRNYYAKQARRQDLAAGGAKNQMEGQKTEGRATILKYSIGCIQQPGGQREMGGYRFQMGGRAPLTPPLATTLMPSNIQQPKVTLCSFMTPLRL